jgi:hypothetical protein
MKVPREGTAATWSEQTLMLEAALTKLESGLGERFGKAVGSRRSNARKQALCHGF